jgi:hypothetical protein
MATTVYNVKNIQTFDDRVIEVSPLKIKWLREFMEIYETLKDSNNDQEAIDLLVECTRICMKQFAPDLSISSEIVEDNFDLQTVYSILETAAGIIKKEDKDEDIKNNVQESGTPWSNLDLASLESEAFLLGIWKDYQELEMSISMPELASLLESKRKLEYEEKKFLAAIQGVDLEKNNEEEDAWTKLKNKVFNGGRKDNDILTFQGQKAAQAGFGIGMGLDYEKID